MKNIWLKKGLVVGIIILFVGTGVVPSISGDIGNNTKATDTATVTNTQPEIVIKAIKGGFGITAVINNVGTADASDVLCTITLSGMVLPKTLTNTYSIIRVGIPVYMKMFVFGLGSITIHVTAASAVVTIPAIVLLVFVKVA